MNRKNRRNTRPPAGMPDCPYARPPARLHVRPSRPLRRCSITSVSSRRKTIELETKLAIGIAERETTKLEAKLKRAEAAVFKLRMEVADVLRATTPVLACMHPHLRSHARTHADMCSRTRARALSLFAHAPAHSHAYTHPRSLRCAHTRSQVRGHARTHARTHAHTQH